MAEIALGVVSVMLFCWCNFDLTHLGVYIDHDVVSLPVRHLEDFV